MVHFARAPEFELRVEGLTDGVYTISGQSELKRSVLALNRPVADKNPLLVLSKPLWRVGG
jgi:hypothetical protein